MNLFRIWTPTLVLVALTAASTALSVDAADESALIEILTSDNTREAKANACRELAWVGTAKAVAPLAALLADEEMNHMARYALETIDDPSVDAVFRENLSALKGRPLVGVIGSVGVRRDGQAVDPLGQLLQDADPDVVKASALSLGSIGGTAAAALLVQAVDENGGQLQLAASEGLLRCASGLVVAGDSDQALELYAKLRRMEGLPYQVREAAVRGALLIGGPRAVRLLRELLSETAREKDYRMFAAVVMATQAMTGRAVTRVLEPLLTEVEPEWQILVIQALGRRGDFEALPVLYAHAETGEVRVRVEAIKAIGNIGVPMGARRLLELAKSEDAAIAAAAIESFGSLPGEPADKAVLSLLDEDDDAARTVGVELIGRRRIAAGLPLLYTLIGEQATDALLRKNAWEQVGDLAGADAMVTLVDLLMADESAIDSAERAISAVCSRAPQPSDCAWALISPLSQAKPTQAVALIRLLGVAGGAEALEVVQATTRNEDDEIQAAAIRTLAGWKAPEVIPYLLGHLEGEGNRTAQTLTLRAYLRWAADPDLPNAERWAMCEKGSTYVKQDQEKRLLLAALAKMNQADALRLIQPYLSQEATREEAATAVVSVAEVLLKGDQADESAADLIKPLEEAVKISGNDALNRRAKSLLRQAQQKAGQ